MKTVLEPKLNGLGLWDTTEMQQKASPLSAMKALKLRPQLNTQRSFRGSIQYSLPRSGSSGLSMSLLDNVSQNVSTANSPKDQSQQNKKARKSSTSRTIRQENYFSIVDSYPLDEIQSERGRKSKSQRTSMSALNPISGNEGAPISSLEEKYHSSMVLDDPFQWDPCTSVPPETSDNGAGCHSRLSDERISNDLPTNTASPKPARLDDCDERCPGQKCSDTVVHRLTCRRDPTQSQWKPASNLQLTPSCGRIPTVAQTPPFSPTLAMFNFYEGADSSPESAVSTPTKKPSRQASCGSRLSSVFDNPFTTSWHLSNEDNPVPYDRHDRASQITNARDTDSRPSSFFDVPNPPKRTRPSWRRPKTPIRGPRSPPHDLRSSSAQYRRPHSPSKSPPKSPSARISKIYNNTSPNFDLRRSIMAPRRQNSEVNNQSNRVSREHKRYLSIGGGNDGESAMISEERDEGHENQKCGEVMGMKESKMVLLLGDEDTKRSRSPVGLYDGKGFLKGM